MEKKSQDNAQQGWTTEDAKALYLIDRWGADYFDINEQGQITVSPLQEGGGSVALYDVLQQAMEEGLSTPLLIRFQDVLRHRVTVLNEAFKSAIAEYDFEGQYRSVYPIKVNQLREVVEEILEAGKQYGSGLEVGSKAEIFAALAMHSAPDALIVCNGYKDATYVRMGLIGTKLGKRVILVAEKLSEVGLIIKVAQQMGIAPLVGLRMRLSTKGSGNWATSGGEEAKFGLSTAEMLRAIDMLMGAGFESSIKLLHFHIGSQIPDILTIKAAVREASRYYAKLRRMGYEIEYLDVGGGLAVDYDGSRSTFHSSMNYSVEEYARDIVYNISDVCLAEEVPPPTIISESGRAVVAHHSVLLVSAFGSIRKSVDRLGDLPDEKHKLVRDLIYIEAEVNEENLLESWHDIVQVKSEAQKMFDVGVLDLKAKASIEILFWRIAQKIKSTIEEVDEFEMPEELMELDSQLADQHICNFSVFQSLLDHWALDQVFPIAPIHRLDEEPKSHSTLVDITCDSDGKVSKFIDLTDVASSIPLHEFGTDPYYLGIFLTGAYQDIMGDIHNLFGRVNEVHVFLDDEEEGGFYIEEKLEGNTVGEVLAMTQYDAKDLGKRFKLQVDRAIKSNLLRPNEGMRLLNDFKGGLNGQTYLDM